MSGRNRIFNPTLDLSPYPQSLDPNFRPQFFRVLEMYQPYKIDNKPCKQHVPNQCAVRLSVALQRAGLTLSLFRDRKRIHQGEAHEYSAACGFNREHILGAQELADFLRQIWNAPRVFSGAAANDARAILAGMTGVVFFKDCFTRKTGEQKIGDHIDLFDGARYFNEVIALSAGGNAGAASDLFGLATEIWFFHLP